MLKEPLRHRSAVSYPMRKCLVKVCCAAALLLGLACQDAADTQPAPGTPAPVGSCPARKPASLPLPGVAPAQTSAEYWLARFTPAQLDTVLLTQQQVLEYDATIGRRPGRDVVSQRDLRVPVDAIALAGDVRVRLTQLRADIARPGLVTRAATPLSAAQLAVFGEPMPTPESSLRVVLEATPMRCGPFDGGLFKVPVLEAYDKNACGTMRAQEAVELLGRSSNGMWLARSRYSLGWLSPSPKLSPQLSDAQAERWVHSTRAYAATDTHVELPGGARVALPKHTLLPLPAADEIMLATADGVINAPRPSSLSPVSKPVTRRAILEAAFSYADSRYGLGDANGGRDCSGLLLDLFDAFDVALPRHSGWQAEAGSFTVDLTATNDAEKLRRLDQAADSGIVLIYFPGHIMLYLGRDAAGVPMAFHALGEYVEPCAKGGETVVDVQHTVVTTLDLGRGTSRRSFLERATRLVVFGSNPPPALQATLVARSAAPSAPAKDAPCSDSPDARIFSSPALALTEAPLRIIATSSADPGAAQLRVFDGNGQPPPMDELRLGGPPFARVARIPRPAPGVYTAVLGTASTTLACKRFRVRADALAPRSIAADAPIWEPRWRWERDTENLWAAFVERLFDGAADDEQTWTNLHSLLQDPNRNLLYDHLGLHEDAVLSIEPDCADLPYALRAYFAWKLRLPYAFRGCARGRQNRPPTCGELRTTLVPRTQPDEIAAFSDFVNRAVRPGVHSGTGRTAPDDTETDLYPVALTRASLAPGTVYADPYGHVMMISKWFAQGSIPGSRYGVLMAAEAQPDGTVGRRRFWQGSFLFDPSTTSVGAGWKRMRPLEYDRPTQTLIPLDNAALAQSREFAPFSLQQYQGTREDFYDRMDALINPQPLDPHERMLSLVDALDEAAQRRVLAVDNGELYVREHPRTVIAMPRGADIFETEGPWEDFATPSRDMRLLIAIDTVLDLPRRVERTPERFALPTGADPKKVASDVRAALTRTLAARSFTYTRSDGSRHTLTLKDVVERSKALELAYNPGSCAEERWGAPEGSPEHATCTRTPPPEQRARMLQYRTWFHTRTRPARGE